MITFKRSDVNLQLAIRAHSGTSFSPEKRGESYVNGYMADMQEIVDRFAPFATDENKAQLAADLEAYRVKYLELMNKYLHSHSAVMSTMITGPANFPTARNRKRSDWADAHLHRWVDWEKAAQERLARRYDPREIARAARVVRSDDPQAIEKLEDKLAKLIESQELMKAVNKVLRGKGEREDKEKDLTALGFTDTHIAQLFTPDCFGGIGFPSYRLTNNNATIKTTRDRLESLKREATRAPVEDAKYLPNVRMTEDKEDMRLKLFFDGKPSAEVRSLLKSRGFKWSPSNEAWQRLLNNNARSAAREIKPKLAELLG